MPKTDAERQQAWRERRTRLIAILKQENARLRADLAEAEHLAAQQCRHPAAAVDGGHCHTCRALLAARDQGDRHYPFRA